MLGASEPYDSMPSFFSDQYDVGLEYFGHAPGWERIVVRGDPASRAFVVFWLARGRVLAGMHVNVWDAAEPIRALVADGRPVDEARLADPDVPLDQVLGAGAVTT
jgi:3-phenylpropionate/trans-cinnamate dioxygenase ferredoxin reductase component